MNEKTTDASEFEQPERAELFTHETPIEDTPSALPGSFVTKTRLLSITGSLLPRWSETMMTYRKPGRGLPQKVESFQWLPFSIQTIRQTIGFSMYPSYD